MKPIKILNKLNEESTTSLVSEYYNRLTEFFKKYDVTIEPTTRYIRFYSNIDKKYPDEHISFEDIDITKCYYGTRIKMIVSNAQNFFRNDFNIKMFSYLYLSRVYGKYTISKDSWGDVLLPEYTKKRNEMIKDIRQFVSSCKDLEKAELKVIEGKVEDKETKEQRQLGDNPITIVYKPQDWEGSLNINQVKQRLSDLKYKCEKVGSKYYFSFNRDDEEEVKQRYNVLKDIADVELM